MQIRYFRALGSNSVVVFPRPSPWTLPTVPLRRGGEALWSLSCTCGRAQESQGSRGAAPHQFMYFVTQLLALKMLLKNKK